MEKNMYIFFVDNFKQKQKTIFNFVITSRFLRFFLLSKLYANHLHCITLRTSFNATNTFAYLQISLSIILHAVAYFRKFFFFRFFFRSFSYIFFFRNRCFLPTILGRCCCCCSTSFKFFHHFCRETILYFTETHAHTRFRMPNELTSFWFDKRRNQLSFNTFYLILKVSHTPDFRFVTCNRCENDEIHVYLYQFCCCIFLEIDNKSSQLNNSSIANGNVSNSCTLIWGKQLITEQFLLQYRTKNTKRKTNLINRNTQKKNKWFYFWGNEPFASDTMNNYDNDSNSSSNSSHKINISKYSFWCAFKSRNHQNILNKRLRRRNGLFVSSLCGSTSLKWPLEISLHE